MARLRDNDDDLLFQSGLYTSSPASISSQKKEADTLPTPGVYTRSSGVKTSSYRELINKDAERQYYESSPGHPESAYAEPPSFAPASSLSEPALKRRSKPAARRGEGSMARPSYSQADHHLPHELDVLWSGTRSLFKEDRPPIVVFSLGLMIGVGLTSAVFLLLMNRPAALTATTLTNPDSTIATAGASSSSGIPLNQSAEQAVSQAAIKEPNTEPPFSEEVDSRNSTIPTAGTRHLRLSRDGAIQAAADEPIAAKANDATSSPSPSSALPARHAATVLANPPVNSPASAPSLFGIKLAWPSFKFPGMGNATPSENGATPPSAPAPVQESQLYEVKPGDTLGSIGSHFLGDSSPVAIQRIQEANHLSSPDKLALGQKLIIPAK